MTIRNSNVALGATFSPTGGSVTPLVTLKSDAGSVRTFLGESGVTPFTRKEIEFKATSPYAQPSAPGGYSQGRASVRVLIPKVLANGNRTFNTGEVKIAIDPESTAADLQAIKSALINFLVDSDFDQLWLNQSLD